jgi:hypothetical protein
MYTVAQTGYHYHYHEHILFCWTKEQSMSQRKVHIPTQLLCPENHRICEQIANLGCINHVEHTTPYCRERQDMDEVHENEEDAVEFKPNGNWIQQILSTIPVAAAKEHNYRRI